jgi:hypothetical protein
MSLLPPCLLQTTTIVISQEEGDNGHTQTITKSTTIVVIATNSTYFGNACHGGSIIYRTIECNYRVDNCRVSMDEGWSMQFLGFLNTNI